MPSLFRQSRSSWSWLPAGLPSQGKAGRGGPAACGTQDRALQRVPPRRVLRTNLRSRGCSSRFTDEEREAQREHAVIKHQNQELGQAFASQSGVPLMASFGFPRGPPHSLSLEQTPQQARRLTCEGANRPERKQDSQTIFIVADDNNGNEDEADEDKEEAQVKGWT